MVYITGNTHSDFDRLSEENFSNNKKVNSEFVLLYEDSIPLEYESIF